LIGIISPLDSVQEDSCLGTRRSGLESVKVFAKVTKQLSFQDVTNPAVIPAFYYVMGLKA
jgi:hypothetical protein